MEQRDHVDALVQLTFAVQAALAEVASRHDLSPTQLRLLGILRDREAAMLDLARHLGLTKSSVTGLVDRAEARGLVQRASGEHDGRAVHVRLTPRGRALARRLEADAEAAIGEVLEPLVPAQRDRLARIAGVVVAARSVL